MKKRRYLFLGTLLLLMLSFGVLYGGNNNVACAMTKKQIDKKITTLKKEIRSLEKKKKAAVKKEKKQAKGTETIALAEVISNHPLIVHPLHGFDDTYYWVENTKYMTNFWGLYSGSVKLTGKYRNYNGITCAVCNSVKVDINSIKYGKAITKKKKKLSKYRNSLNEKMLLYNTKVSIGGRKKVDCMWRYSGAYNKVTWKSSNTKVATIDSKGRIKGINQGKATITATCSISKKKTTCTVCVMDRFKVYNAATGKEIQKDAIIRTDQASLLLKTKFNSSNTRDTIKYEVEFGESVASITQDGLISFNSNYEGEEVGIKVSSSYFSIRFSVESSIENSGDNNDEDNNDDIDDDDYPGDIYPGDSNDNIDDDDDDYIDEEYSDGTDGEYDEDYDYEL